MGEFNLNLGIHLSLLRQVFDIHQQAYLRDLASRVAKMEKMQSFELTDDMFLRLKQIQESIQKAITYEESSESYINQLETDLAGKQIEADYWKQQYQQLTRRHYRAGGYRTPRLTLTL
jgi:hypothetical protein